MKATEVKVYADHLLAENYKQEIRISALEKRSQEETKKVLELLGNAVMNFREDSKQWHWLNGVKQVKEAMEILRNGEEGDDEKET